MGISAKPEPDQFKGQVAVVTGGGSGIGRSMATLLAKLGARVLVCDIDAGAAEQTASAIVEEGGSAGAHALDVTDAAAVTRLADEVFAAEGRVDILHNNAGIGHAGPVEQTPLEDWHRVIDVNLFGVINGLSAFVPRMIEQGGESHIVNTASMAGLQASAGMAPYCTSKFGVVGMSIALDAELKEKGIRVTALCPGVIDTSIVERSTMRGPIAGRQEKLTRFYKKRGASPDVVARDAVTAILRRQVIKPTPWWQVSPGWWLMRISPRAYNVLARRAYKAIIGS